MGRMEIPSYDSVYNVTMPVEDSNDDAWIIGWFNPEVVVRVAELLWPMALLDQAV